MVVVLGSQLKGHEFDSQLGFVIVSLSNSLCSSVLSCKIGIARAGVAKREVMSHVPLT